MYTALHIQHVHNTICTQHRIFSICIEQYVHNNAYPTCTYHHLYPTPHMQSLNNTICTTLRITFLKQHVHALYIHNTACTQHHICNMYNIYKICTTVVPHIQNHIVSTKQPFFQCFICVFPNMSQTTLLSFR